LTQTGKPARKLSRTARIMIAALVIVFAALLVLGLTLILFVIPFEKPLAYVAGLTAGSAVSVIKIILMDRGLNHIADMGEAGKHSGARNYAALQVFLRNALTVAVFATAFLFKEIIGPFGVIFGILSIQASALIAGFLLRHESAKI